MNRYILIFFASIFAWSQQIIELPEFSLSDLDESQNTLTLFSNDKIYSIELDSLTIKTRDIDYFDFDKNRFYIKKVNEKTYFFKNGSGEVYLDKESKIERIDQSVINNYLIGSSFFTINDTIFRYGGYGYWTVFDKLLYFDLNTNQWEFYQDLGKGRIDHLSLTYQNKAYFMGGHYLSKTSPQIDLKDNTIDQFDFSESSFKTIGETKFSFQGASIIKNDLDKFLLLTKDRSILEIDFKDFTVKKFFNNSLNTKISNKYQTYAYSDKLLFFSDQNNRVFLHVFPLDLFLYETNEKETLLIKDSTPSYIIISILFALLIAIFVFLKWQQSRTIRLQSTTLKFKYNKIEITLLERTILELLVDKKMVESKFIDELVFDMSLSRASNYKRKLETIDKLNIKLQKITNSSFTILINKKSEIDARIKLYHIHFNFVLKAI